MITDKEKETFDNFEDWIIKTGNISRLENGEITELFKEYKEHHYSFIDKISQSNLPFGVSFKVKDCVKNELSSNIYKTLNATA